MKKFLCIRLGLLAILLLVVDSSFAQAPRKKSVTVDTSDCLIFIGKLDESMKSAEGDYTIVLTRDGQEMEKQTLKVKKGFKFTLQRNRRYSFKFEKEGFVSRVFNVSTILEYKIVVKDLYKFSVETNLMSEELYHHFEYEDGKNYMDVPIANISYHKKGDEFQYDKKYTDDLTVRMIDRLLYGGY